MSSLVERLRVRSEKKPRYDLDESDDDLYLPRGGSTSKQEEKPAERIVRDDAIEDACQRCGKNEGLISCGTCTYVFHQKCLVPPLKITVDDRWSCPECVSPLVEVEKILDCELRPAVTDETDSSQPSSKQTYTKQYLVKWKGFSYLHCTWIPEDEFVKASKAHPRLKTRLNNFHRQMDSLDKSDDDWVAIRPEWTTVDRIIASRKTGDEREYFVKWKELPYDECTWEVGSDISAFQSQIEKFNTIQSRCHKKSSNKSKNATRDMVTYDQSPKFLSGGTLHAYQLEGLKFLRYSWLKNNRVILADEMGLGKTIQSIAFLASLFEENITPHLVVAPLSTLRNWEREFATWAPQLNVVMYFGSARAREIIRKYEFCFPKEKVNKHKKKKTSQDSNQKKQSRLKFDVLLTSYEMINMDSAILKPIKWECMIVDEGHRLKNKDSKLFSQLKDYSTNHRVLLTGTPLQNNLDELFMLMHFLDDESFGSIEHLQEEFNDINQDKQIEKLHDMLAPHFLRRFKKDVIKDLPPKKELILRVELSSKQKEYYKAILTRNYQILARRGGAQISLINVVMELRKLCCHAYMLEGVEPDTEPSNTDEGLRQLLDASGKMHLLDKMMVKLKEQEHRVLIYSQFQHMLDLLEDYLTYKKWSYERIDGKIGGAERQIRIDRFNAKNSTRFCFLLSTRAGGLGINLATADTVIIYDSDWNPHADLQAMARAHRLGQTSKVMIYRLISRGTIEERMMQLTKKKMILEHLVVGRLKAQTVNQEELDDIIRYGSKELFADESDEAGKARQIHYDDGAIDRLLNRDQIDGEESLVDEEENDFLKGFKVANFEYIDEAEAAAAKEEELRKRSMADKASSSNFERANYWDELLRDRYGVQQIEEYTTMGKGKRSRKQMTAADEDDLAGLQDVSSEDEDYRYEEDLSDTETSLTGNGSGRRGEFSKKRGRGHMEPLPLMEGEGRSFRVLGFNQNQRAMFVQILMRFGFQDYEWKEFLPRLKGKTAREIQEYSALFMSHILEGVNDAANFSDGVPKEGLRVDDVMVRIANIQLIEEKVEFISGNPRAPLFPEYILAQFRGLLAGRIWKREHDILLLKALLKHGYARWQSIIEDKDVGLADIVRQELNLPSVNGTFTDGVQTDEGAGSAYSVNGTSEATKGNQLGPDYSTLYQFREVQRRIVEFIRKRYHLLEKAMDLEYAMLTMDKHCESTSQDIDPEPKFEEVLNPVSLGTSSILKELPVLEPILADESVYNGKPGYRKVARMYNKMCKVVQDSEVDALHLHLGEKFASPMLKNNLNKLATVCEDVFRIFRVQDHSFAAEASNASAASDAIMPGGRAVDPKSEDKAASPVDAAKLEAMNCSPSKTDDAKTADITMDQSGDGVIQVDD
ncbi:CHD3-type chromatin-remodeling factor PICKLE isoform X2 [Typha latifolia]|uniref:CHD3-type chromatin-remodeling factor PICKLE isoform X2 n=1 Tax=Typha latifolia TaxID=4733 RepID=UPI003C30A16F